MSEILEEADLMHRPRKPKNPFASERGLTLIELIVAASMMIIITGAAIAILLSAMRQQPKLTERADQVGTARVAMERMVRELRQGVVGTVSGTETQLTFESYVDSKCGATTVAVSTRCSVKYSCDTVSDICTRTTGGTSTGTRIATGVTNTNIFTYVKGPSPCSSTAPETYTYVGVAIELRSSDGGKTSLQDGAGLRSCP